MTFDEFVKYQQDYLPFGNPAIGVNDIYYFDTNEEWCEELIRSANFYVEAIQHNSYYLNGLSCRLIFTSHISENARATVFGEKGGIVWHAGLLLRQLDVLNKHTEIFNSLFCTDAKNLLELGVLDNHPSILFYQFCQHFTFYHEFAHIIQQQNKGNSTAFKFPYEPLDYSLNNHLLEIDADIFASLCLSAHILQYAKKIFGNDVEREYLLMLIAIFASSILVYSMKIDEMSIVNDMKSGHHPNPLFRILFAVLNICEYINQNTNHDFKFPEILDLSLNIASNLTEIDLTSYWSEHYDVMMDYYREIHEMKVPDEYESAVNNWNIYNRY